MEISNGGHIFKSVRYLSSIVPLEWGLSVAGLPYYEGSEKSLCINALSVPSSNNAPLERLFLSI